MQNNDVHGTIQISDIGSADGLAQSEERVTTQQPFAFNKISHKKLPGIGIKQNLTPKVMIGSGALASRHNEASNQYKSGLTSMPGGLMLAQSTPHYTFFSNQPVHMKSSPAYRGDSFLKQSKHFVKGQVSNRGSSMD